jgi:hypothetical protein
MWPFLVAYLISREEGENGGSHFSNGMPHAIVCSNHANNLLFCLTGHEDQHVDAAGDYFSGSHVSLFDGGQRLLK